MAGGESPHTRNCIKGHSVRKAENHGFKRNVQSRFSSDPLRLLFTLSANASTVGIKGCHSYYPERTTFDILLKFSIHSKRVDTERVLCVVCL